MKMKGLIITHKGAEKFSVDEILEISSVKINYVGNGFIIFEIDDLDKLKNLAYKGQSFLRVLELIDDFVSENLFDDLIVKSSFIKLKGSFRVKCTRKGKHNFTSSDIESKIGEIIINSNSDCNVDLCNPETVVHIYINDNKCYICKDLCIYDLSKRDYKIFIHPASIKGTLAYLMIKMSGYDKKGILVDPFCGSGTIPIEAALYANNISINYYSKNKFLFELNKKEKNIWL
jgi:putative N6-adenine-specific DNA methylase